MIGSDAGPARAHEAERPARPAADAGTAPGSAARGDHGAELASVMDAFSVGVLLVSPRGPILAMNRAVKDLFDVDAAPAEGVSPGLLGRLRARWPDGRAVEFDETPFARARRGEVVHDVVVALDPPGRARRWIQIGAAPLGDPGRVHTVVVTVVDVTRAREADQDREELLAHVVGDLAPALDRIVARARILRAEGACAEPAGELLRAARRLGGTLRELETALRFDAGALAAAPELVDVRAFVLDLLERGPPGVDASRVVASAPPGLPCAVVDPDHLERILVELLHGALAGGSTEAHVLVACEEVEGRLRLTVAASGHDVPVEDLPHVFDRFYRWRGRPAWRLHVVRGLVEANHGRVVAGAGPVGGLAIRASFPARRG